MFERVQRVTADLFQLRPEQITPRSCAEEIPGWDSVQHLNLVLALEDEFGVRFDPEEIDEMKTVGQIVALLEGKLSRSA